MNHAALEGMIGEFLERTYGCLGNLARPNHTFYSLEMVTLAFDPLREALRAGKTLTPRGDRFVACAMAHLAYLTYLGFQRRRLETHASVRWDPDEGERRMGIFASRPEGETELLYGQEFLRDCEVLLDPPDPFPGEGDGGVVLGDGIELSLEYLYLVGVHLMISPRGLGNWPKRPDEKEMRRGLRGLVDDLVVDLHLVPGDRAQERFCAAAIWPPAGWPGNRCQEQNLSQLLRRVGEDEEEGVDFLWALSRAQMTSLRRLAARCLLVLGRGPRDHDEKEIFAESFATPGAARALAVMGQARWQREKGEGEAPVAFLEDAEKAWRLKVESAPEPGWLSSPVLEDPLYSVGKGNVGSADLEPEIAHQLLRSYPDEWWAYVILGRALLHSGETVAGRKILQRAAEESPGDLTAHESLIEDLWRRRRIAEADRLCQQAVELRPWSRSAVELAVKLRLDGLVR